MKVQNANRWAPRGPGAWYFAAAALSIATGLRLSLHPVLGPIMPGAVYLASAALTAYFFGIRPALAVLICGLGMADFFFVPPYRQIEALNRSDLGLLFSFPVVGIPVVVLIEKLRRMQFQSELIGLVAKSRYEMLLRADNQRVLASRSVDETHRLLRHLPHYHDSIILIQAIDSQAVARTSNGGDASGATLMPAAMEPGILFSQIHPDDLQRLSSTLTPGSHRARILIAQHRYRPVECICETFTTHVGDFLVLRLEG
jgi:K+-sensing histidine kinase KdpD